MVCVEKYSNGGLHAYIEGYASCDVYTSEVPSSLERFDNSIFITSQTFKYFDLVSIPCHHVTALEVPFITV
jgi:hypothetical protein